MIMKLYIDPFKRPLLKEDLYSLESKTFSLAQL